MLHVETLYSGIPARAVATLVRVRGEIDIASAAAFRDTLRASDSSLAGGLIVCLDDCTYFDSTGLAALVAVHGSIGTQLKIILPPNTIVHRIFEITGLHRALNVVASISEALQGSTSEEDGWSVSA